jgi:hypothetical protein
MMVVQQARELLVPIHCLLEQRFLDVARHIAPYVDRRHAPAGWRGVRSVHLNPPNALQGQERLPNSGKGGQHQAQHRVMRKGVNTKASTGA